MSDAPGPLLATRDALVAILEGAGVGVLPEISGRFLPPAALIEPGDPFVGPAVLAGAWHTIRWRVVLVVGAGGSGPNLIAMAALTERVVLAIHAATGWSSPTVSGPRLLRTVGVEGGYTAAELFAETIADMTPHPA